MTVSDLVAAVTPVADALQSLGVPFYLTGSLASSTHGLPRTSADVDVVADLKADHVDRLATILERDFYLDRDRMHAAVDRHRSFNVIHLASTFKIDIFVSRGRPFDMAALQRAESRQLEDAAGSQRFPMASAEDVILSKLEWFKTGGETSERQWSDVVGVFRVQRGRLQLEYLRRTAQALSVAALLERALAEASRSAED